MPLPIDLTSITVTATYEDGSGAPLFGYVTFTPSAELTDSTGHVILRAAPISAQLFRGSISQVLACTDNANIAPSGWYWIVNEVIGNAAGVLTQRTYNVLLPHSLGSTVDLSTLVPITTLPNTSAFAVVAGANTFTATQTFAAPVIYTGTNSSVTGFSRFYEFDVTKYGAKGNGRTVLDGAMNSGQPTLTCSTSTPFVLTDVGKSILVKGAGASGVTTLVTTISAYVSPSQVTLAANAGATITGAIVAYASDDTAAFQAAVNAATSYAQTNGAGEGVVSVPPSSGSFYGIAGPLVTTASGNSQITLPVIGVVPNKVTLVIQGVPMGATGAHWMQTVFQSNGSTLVSFLPPFASQSAQNTNISANGDPAIIGGPLQPAGYGTSALLYSNMHVVLSGVTMVTPYSANGWNVCGANLSGVAQASVMNCNIGVSTTYVSGDLFNVSTLAGGFSKGLLMPANGNNDICEISNLSVWGGYTWDLLATEHTVMHNCRLLYGWSGLALAGTYFNSVGALHAFYADQMSMEGNTNLIYVFGQGQSGIGPFLDIAQLDTESAAPTWADNGGGGVLALRGRVNLRGQYTLGNITVNATNLEIVNGQQPPGPVATPSMAINTAVRNNYWRWATVYLAGGTVTSVQVGATMGGASAPSMTSVYTQSSASLPLTTVRVGPGGWLQINGSVLPTTNNWVLD